MRKKLNSDIKRSVIIGVKVKQETKDKIKYLSDAEGDAMSTYINNILENHIEERTKFGKIKWEEVFKEE